MKHYNSEHLNIVKKFLNKQSLTKYAIRVCCLELRFALEKLTYAKLGGYEKYLDIEKMKKTYQPSQIIEKIYNKFPEASHEKELKIDFKPSFLDSINKGLTNKQKLKENSLKLFSQPLEIKKVKKYYNKLGNHLHAQKTLGERSNLTRESLIEIYDFIKEYNSNDVLNISMTNGDEYRCYNCKKNIALDLFSIDSFFLENPTKQTYSYPVRCQNCGLIHHIEKIDSKLLTKPYFDIKKVCPNCNKEVTNKEYCLEQLLLKMNTKLYKEYNKQKNNIIDMMEGEELTFECEHCPNKFSDKIVLAAGFINDE